MDLHVSPVSRIPIYEQLKQQIREQVLTGRLSPGVMLPSIRGLARECQVGIITVKRAYDDLCMEGILNTHPGKGVFVAELSPSRVRDIWKEQVKEQLADVLAFATGAGLSAAEVEQLWKEVAENGTADTSRNHMP